MESLQINIDSALSDEEHLRLRFDTIRTIGSGAAGKVLLVRDRFEGGRVVALKILENKEAFGTGTSLRFKQEIETLRAFRHAHIVTAYEFVVLHSTYGYTMEYVEAPDLGKILHRRRLTYTEIDLIFTQLLDALSQLHSRGIFHRDIKLENVLYSPETGVKLTDFGLVKAPAADPLTQTGILLGTAHYFPPEYLRQGRYDARSELYAVGLMLLELLTGSRRFEDMQGQDVIKHLLATNFSIDKDQIKGLPFKYQLILEAALEPTPSKRFASALDMREAFICPSDEMLVPIPVNWTGQMDDYEEPQGSLLQVLPFLVLDPTCLALEGMFLILLLASLLRWWMLAAPV